MQCMHKTAEQIPDHSGTKFCPRGLHKFCWPVLVYWCGTDQISGFSICLHHVNERKSDIIQSDWFLSQRLTNTTSYCQMQISLTLLSSFPNYTFHTDPWINFMKIAHDLAKIWYKIKWVAFLKHKTRQDVIGNSKIHYQSPAKTCQVIQHVNNAHSIIFTCIHSKVNKDWENIIDVNSCSGVKQSYQTLPITNLNSTASLWLGRFWFFWLYDDFRSFWQSPTVRLSHSISSCWLPLRACNI